MWRETLNNIKRTFLIIFRKKIKLIIYGYRKKKMKIIFYVCQQSKKLRNKVKTAMSNKKVNNGNYKSLTLN